MASQAPSRLKRVLGSSRAIWIAAGAAVLLNLPSLTTGWQLDDLFHRAHFLEVGPMTDGSNMTHRMFDFLSGDAEEILALKDVGVLPWWTMDTLEVRFWRPLSSFTHVVDYWVWPDSAVLMHAHSVFWLAVLILAVGVLYRRLLGATWVAGAAVLLYAVDDARGFPTGFLANRNALIATAFGALSVALLDRWRRDGWKPGAVLSPLCFGFALLGGESGIGAAPYLLGYVLFLGSGTGIRRLFPIVPHAWVGISWLVVYKLSGYGTSGTGFYLDPMGQPFEWFSQFLLRAPLLLLGQWFLPPSSLAFAWTPAQTLVVALFGVVAMTGVFWLLRPILSVDPVAKFFAFGMLLAVVPITAGFPHDRLLFFVGIGATGLLAKLLSRLFDREISPAFGRPVGIVLVVVHVVLAVPLHVLMSTSTAAQEPIYAGPTRSLPDDPALEAQRLVVVNPPSAFYAQYDLLVRRFDGRPAPASLLLMAPGITRLTFTRSSSVTLEVEAEDGFLISAFDNVYRGETWPVPQDYEVSLSDVHIRVTGGTSDGRPRSVRFTFAHDLENVSFRFVRYEGGRYVPFALPPEGGSVVVEPVPFSLISPESS